MSVLTSSLSSTSGFHTAYKTRINPPHPSSLANCSVHLIYSLPPQIFFDPYELVHYRHLYTFSHWGTANLELPSAAVDAGGSVLLLNLTLLAAADTILDETEVEVPLHARYGEPESLGYYTAEIPRPEGFLACPSSYSAHSQPLPSMPAPLSYLFDPSSQIFTSLSVSGNDSLKIIRVPVGSYDDLLKVEVGTSLIILLLFFTLSRTLYITADRLSRGRRHVKAE